MNASSLASRRAGKTVLTTQVRGDLRTVVTSTVQATDTVLLWLERHRQRRSLAQLSDHVLKDIGLTRADAYGEVRKRFWNR